MPEFSIIAEIYLLTKVALAWLAWKNISKFVHCIYEKVKDAKYEGNSADLSEDEPLPLHF